LASTIIAALGGLLFGFDTAVISGTTGALTEVYQLNESWLGIKAQGFWLGFTVASALVGTVMGAIAVSWPADRWGRRTTLAWTAVMYFASAVGCALAWNWASFLFFRWLGGLAVGGASVVSPMYIAEISPAAWRGRLVAVQQFNIVLGILLAYLSNYIVAGMDVGQSEWRWMFGVQAAPAAAFFVLLFFTPRSPRWLVAKGRLDEARFALARLGTDSGSVEEEILAIRESLESEQQAMAEPLFQKKYLWPLALAVTIAMFNQLSGINALMYYAGDIFRMAGAGKNAALFNAVVIGLTSMVFTMLALAAVDLLGRRRLMIVGSIGYILSLTTTAWAFHFYGTQFTNTGGLIVLVSLMVFIASHAFGQGAVIWVFISEIFPNAVRARGAAFACFVLWVTNAIISWTFPIVAQQSAASAFAAYAAMMVLQLVWVLAWMPETKGVPLEEIQKRLGIE
jgi:sugar porter (SP) family MFS transporter